MTKPITTLYPASREHPPRVEGEVAEDAVSGLRECLAHRHSADRPLCFMYTPRPRRFGPNGTGRVCGICGATTYGLSDACGKCGSRVR